MDGRHHRRRARRALGALGRRRRRRGDVLTALDGGAAVLGPPRGSSRRPSDVGTGHRRPRFPRPRDAVAWNVGCARPAVRRRRAVVENRSPGWEPDGVARRLQGSG
jgi:hypothetical protein